MRVLRNGPRNKALRIGVWNGRQQTPRSVIQNFPASDSSYRK